MELRDYTSFADVRAALGVSEKELSDETLSLSLYEDNLKMELDNIGDTFTDEYDALLVADSPNKAEEKLLRAGRLFCTYVVANHLLSSMTMFSPKDISDGKASFSRQGDNPYSKTIEMVKSRYSQYTAGLGEVYADFKTTTTVTTAPVYMLVSSPTTNPITG